MSDRNVVQLSLDQDDHFFQNIERSRRASGLSVRQRRASQVAISNQAWLGNASSPRAADVDDMSRVAIRLHPQLLGARFSALFASVWFQRLLTLMVLGLSSALTAGEPSTPLAVAVFSVIYCGTAICLASRLEFSLLLGEVAHRFQAIFMLLWGLVLVVASGYQSGFEYDTVGLAAGLSKSEYTSQIACSMVFNATAFAVVVLLDAMPTLAPLTKAGALLLFVGNAVRLWITDRFVLKTLLRPQMLCSASPLLPDSCIDTQRMKVAALSSVCIFLMHSFYVSMHNAWFLAPGQLPVFGVIRSQMTVELLEADTVLTIEVEPEVALLGRPVLVSPSVVVLPPGPPSLPGNIAPLVEMHPLPSGSHSLSPARAVSENFLTDANSCATVTGLASTAVITIDSNTTLMVHPTHIVASGSLIPTPQTAIATSVPPSAAEASHTADAPPIDLRTEFLLDFPMPQRYLDPLLGHWLYELLLLRSMKVAYAILAVICIGLFMTGQPNSLFMVPVVAVLMCGMLFCSVIMYDRALLRDLCSQFEYGFLVASIVVYVAMSQFYYDSAIYAVYIGYPVFVVRAGDIVNTVVWMIASLCLVSFDASFATLIIKRWISILWLINNCYVLYSNVFLFPLQTVLLAGETVPRAWLESSRWCLAGECISAQSVRIQVLTTVIFFTAKYSASLIFRPRSMIILKAGISFECTDGHETAVLTN